MRKFGLNLMLGILFIMLMTTMTHATMTQLGRYMCWVFFILAAGFHQLGGED